MIRYTYTLTPTVKQGMECHIGTLFQDGKPIYETTCLSAGMARAACHKVWQQKIEAEK
jgi:hypothetical protein